MKKTTTSKKVTRAAKRNVESVFNTSADLRTSMLIISVLVNLIILCLWVIVRVTNQYDSALASFFFNR